jgi:formate hydrogenlyase subunit 3/multisubunit Na+/H+ antiporter MnhD subunit
MTEKDAGPKGDELTPREHLMGFLYSLPFTIGFFWLLPYLEGADKVGWIWWVSLIGTVFATATTVVCSIGYTVHLIRKYFGPKLDRIGDNVAKIWENVAKFIAAIVVCLFYGWIALMVTDEISGISQREIVAFFAGGLVVYLLLESRRG